MDGAATTNCPSAVIDIRELFCRTPGDLAHVSMPGVHRIAALLKRWLLSTHQGSVSGKHLDYYFDKYTFRFNRRASQSRGMLFYRLMAQAVMTAPLPYKQIIQRKHNM